MLPRQYRSLIRVAHIARQRLERRRQPFKAQLPVFRQYDYSLRRGSQMVLMSLWELKFLMKTTLDDSPIRYQLYLSSKGELVGYVKHASTSTLHGRQEVFVLAVLVPDNFAHLSDEEQGRLSLELHELAEALGAQQ